MPGTFLFVIILCSIVPYWALLPNGSNAYTDFGELFKFPRNAFLPQFGLESKTGIGETKRKVIDVSIGSEALSTKFSSGVNTFSAYTGISTTIVAVVTVGIIAFPFVILLFYLSLVFIFPDPMSPVQFERDIAVTMKHLKYVATDVEDRVFDFLEEITDPKKYTQENPPSPSYGSNNHYGHNLGSQQFSIPYHQNQYSHPVDSYVQYTSNQNHYQPSVKKMDGQNTHWFSNTNLASNNVQRPIQTTNYPQYPHSKNLVVQLPVNQYQYPIKQQVYQLHKGYAIRREDPIEETRRLSHGQPAFHLQNIGSLGYPLRNNAFDPSYNVGPVKSPTAMIETPLIDQRGETPKSIELQLKALAQLNSNQKNGHQIVRVSSFTKDQKLRPSPPDGTIMPRNSLNLVSSSI